jgi:hypothetical protein
MPCSSDYSDSELSPGERRELDDTTDMLCRVLKNLDQLPQGIRGHLVPLDVSRWYDKHKAFDKSQGR